MKESKFNLFHMCIIVNQIVSSLIPGTFANLHQAQAEHKKHLNVGTNIIKETTNRILKTEDIMLIGSI